MPGIRHDRKNYYYNYKWPWEGLLIEGEDFVVVYETISPEEFLSMVGLEEEDDQNTNTECNTDNSE